MTKPFLAALLAALLVPPISFSRAAECAPAGVERQVATRIQAFFDAMTTDDSRSWSDIVDPTFYAFDANRRLDGNALFDLVKSAHNAGVKIVWRLDEIDVHVDCATAWFSLMNRGTVGGANGTQQVSWQESGIFNYVQGQWKLHFFHSNRVQQNN
jgi:hypothetical protein